jgi:hypothetical protein
MQSGQAAVLPAPTPTLNSITHRHRQRARHLPVWHSRTGIFKDGSSWTRIMAAWSALLLSLRVLVGYLDSLDGSQLVSSLAAYLCLTSLPERSFAQGRKLKKGMDEALLVEAGRFYNRPVSRLNSNAANRSPPVRSKPSCETVGGETVVRLAAGMAVLASGLAEVDGSSSSSLRRSKPGLL